LVEPFRLVAKKTQMQSEALLRTVDAHLHEFRTYKETIKVNLKQYALAESLRNSDASIRKFCQAEIEKLSKMIFEVEKQNNRLTTEVLNSKDVAKVFRTTQKSVLEAGTAMMKEVHGVNEKFVSHSETILARVAHIEEACAGKIKDIAE
jgi:hypothetical protein